MAVATGTLRRRGSQEAQAAAKAKRQKLILIVGSVVLVAVLAFQVPRLLKSSSSSSSTSSSSTTTASTPGEATVPPATAGAATVAPTISAAQAKHDLAVIARNYPTKDPFKVQISTGTTSTSQPAPTIPKDPSVRRSHFVVKDPFKVQVSTGATTPSSSAPTFATPPVVKTPKVHKTASSAPYGYIVILRSLDSKAAALREVKAAHAQGFRSAGVLYSSKYTTLRHGYWVVYLNKYPTWNAANAGLQAARAHGYSSAYRRPVRR
jgi:sporulation related protein